MTDSAPSDEEHGAKLMGSARCRLLPIADALQCFTFRAAMPREAPPSGQVRRAAMLSGFSTMVDGRCAVFVIWLPIKFFQISVPAPAGNRVASFVPDYAGKIEARPEVLCRK